MNEVSVKTSATLSYYAGALRAARAELARIEASAGDYGAMHGEAMEAARLELAAAEFDFKAEFQACQALEELAAMEAAPAKVAPVQAKPVKVRCLHHRAIKRAFAIAKNAGLDTTKAGKARMRHCFESVIGRCVDSRAEYTGEDWLKFGDAILNGAARW